MIKLLALIFLPFVAASTTSETCKKHAETYRKCALKAVDDEEKTGQEEYLKKRALCKKEFKKTGCVK